MRIDSKGRFVDEPQIKAAFIGAGSHSYRNLYPSLQFAPVDLVAVCDLKADKAKAYAKQFGAPKSYTDYREMLKDDGAEAVFICTSYDDRGFPQFPEIAVDCLKSRKHVWMEKPATATMAQVDAMQAAQMESGKNVMCGYKKMFFPANVKAKRLMDEECFGGTDLVTMRYSQGIPPAENIKAYMEKRLPKGDDMNFVISFLDHICHPTSLMIMLLGYPKSMFYQVSDTRSGLITFQYENGTLVSLVCAHGGSSNGGLEFTYIKGRSRYHITIENNIRVTRHHVARLPYGESPDFYSGDSSEGSLTWEPEFSLGHLYNKSLYVQGYVQEITEFANSILEKREPARAGLDDVRMITRIFEACAEGPNKIIQL